MLSDLKLLDMASAMARHAAARHEVLAENIANADTAGFRAKDIESFDAAFTRSENGLSGAEGGFSFRVLDASLPGSESPNGNTVSLEDQMVRSAEAMQSHEAATAIYKKSIDILRMTLGRNA